MKRALFIILVLALLAAMLPGCAPAAQPTAAPQPTTAPAQATKAPEATKAPATAAPSGGAQPIKIDFWHAMSGKNGEVIQAMVDKFNKSQNEVFVTATFQGSYDDEINKLKAGLQSKNVPAVVQIYDLGTRLLTDLKVITPMQNFIDEEKFDISDIEPNILNYYTVDGKLQSMPFNSSNPVLYYNKKAFKEANLDPEKPPRTWAEVADYARKLTKKDASGKVTQYGIGIAIYGWFVEQWNAVEGQYYVNNENGRKARATAATFNNDKMVALLDWWKGMVDEGICANLGRATSDTQKAFDAGTIAMTLDSTAILRARIDAAQGKFDVGVGFLPRQSEEDYKKSGTIIGGASLWILNARPQAEQDAAWKFVKFMVSADQQAFWHINTGYYPVNAKGYNHPDDVAWRTKYPQFQVAIDQLHMAPKNNVTAGGLIGVFPEARQTVEKAVEAYVTGKIPTAKQALDEAAKSVTQSIQDYNDTVK